MLLGEVCFGKDGVALGIKLTTNQLVDVRILNRRLADFFNLWFRGLARIFVHFFEVHHTYSVPLLVVESVGGVEPFLIDLGTQVVIELRY
jgi:hypothetical protein